MIELKNVSKFYSSEGSMAVGIQNVSLSYDLGEFVAITGESGSGKSTLLSVISGLDSYEEGEMLINGKSTSDYTREDFDRYRNQMVGFVFQNYNLIDSYSVLENVMLPLLAKGMKPKDARKDALSSIEKVGLKGRIRSKASKLSGGEKQRTVIARALASGAPIIACDEPTGNLDSHTGKEILELLNNIRENRLILIVTHDYNAVAPYCTRHTILKDGHVADDRTISPKGKVEGFHTNEGQDIKKANLVHIAWTNVVHTPRRTFLSLLMATVTSMAILSIIGGFIQTNDDLTDLYNQEVVSIYSNRAKNRIVVYPEGDETESVSSILSGTDAYVDDGNFLSDLSFMLNNGTYDPAPEEEDVWSRLNEQLYDVKANFVIHESMTLVDGHAPTAVNEFALILNSALNYTEALKGVSGVLSDAHWTVSNYDANSYDNSLTMSQLTCVGFYTMPDMQGSVGWMPSLLMTNAIRTTILEYCRRDFEVCYYSRSSIAESVSILIDGKNHPYSEYYGMVVYENNDPVSGDVISRNNVVVVDSFFEGKTIQFKIYNQVVDIPSADIVYHDFDFASTYGDVPFLFTGLYVRALAAETQVSQSIFVKNQSDLTRIHEDFLDAGYETYRSDASVESLDFTYILGNLYIILLTILSFAGYLILGFVTFLVTRVVFMLIYQNKKKDYAIFETLGFSKGHVRFVNRSETALVFIASYLLATTALFLISGSPYSIALVWSKPYLLLISLGIIFLLALLIARRYEKKLFALTVNKVLKAGDFLD